MVDYLIRWANFRCDASAQTTREVVGNGGMNKKLGNRSTLIDLFVVCQKLQFGIVGVV
jgi:hypothetical protein